MRILHYARERGRAARQEVGEAPGELQDWLCERLLEKHRITLEPVSKKFLRGGKGEIAPQEKTLYYWRSLDLKPVEKLWVIAHEYGHLLCHNRLTRHATIPDPIRGSDLINYGTGELSRYSPRSREEAEANAFAAEFLAPSDEIFRQWREDPSADSLLLAQRHGVPVSLVRAQLAHALYNLVTENASEDETGDEKESDCDGEQEEAATCLGSPVLVNAGPGTGKTKTLVRRVEYLVKEKKQQPETLLALTFSNDAAEEMRIRINAKLGEEVAKGIEIATFHGFGLSFLDKHGHVEQLPVNLQLLDDAGQEELLSDIIGSVDCYKIVNLRDPGLTASEIARHIRYLKDRLVTPADLSEYLEKCEEIKGGVAARDEAEAFFRVYSEYEVTKRKNHMLDFADMLALPIKILKENPEIKTLTQNSHRWIMVDEYQDVSRAVAILLQQISRNDSPPWVVGDIQQAIYLFRGAAPENILRFPDDFKDGINKLLQKNYRSADPIIHAANQMATLINSPDHSTPEVEKRWASGKVIPPIDSGVLGVIKANCDAAERDAIAQQVALWIENGVKPGNIAILSRRNIDVRNIVLELSKRDIPARASGVVTADGAAGDLAAAALFVDRPGACLARLAFCLAQECFTSNDLNKLVSELLLHAKTEDVNGERREVNPTACESDASFDGLRSEIRKFSEMANGERMSSDAFTMMCIFLFDATGYLRRLLDASDDSKKSLTLIEIVTALSRAASYRFSHPKLKMWDSRIWFGDYFRRALTSGEPSPLVPRGGDSVRVMTCHASKGLEFPCVIVSGQTMPLTPTQYKWLPPELAPKSEEDALSADALLFVGATRAQQALLVTCAETAGGTPRSRRRDTPSLLERWIEVYSIPVTSWETEGVGHVELAMNAIWGGKPGESLSVRLLGKDKCQLRTYLEEYLGLRYPLRQQPLYPFFVESVRQGIQEIVRRANVSGHPVTGEDVEKIVDGSWTAERYQKHPLRGFYRNIATAVTKRFATAYVPPSEPAAQLDLVLSLNGGEEESAEMKDSNILVKMGLLAHLRNAKGETSAIALGVDSLKQKVSKRKNAQGVNWSGVSETHQISFVLLRRLNPNIRPLIFSAMDGIIYEYLWSRDPSSMDVVAEAAISRHRSYRSQSFRETLNLWKCDHCPVRISCPYWIGALA